MANEKKMEKIHCLSLHMAFASPKQFFILLNTHTFVAYEDDTNNENHPMTK